MAGDTTTTTILITGAGGFLGSRLAPVIASLPSFKGQSSATRFLLADVHEPKAPAELASLPGVQSKAVKCDLTNDAELEALFNTEYGRPDVIYAMHGIMSLGSEENWDLGFAVNFTSVQALLNKARKYATSHPSSSSTLEPIRFIFTSSTATYGQPLPEVVLPTTACFPAGAYGFEKLMGEYFVTEYTRKGWIQGLSCKLPTIVVRPGPPSRATSSFVSGIIREPLHGEDATCPIGSGLDDRLLDETKLFVASAGTTLANLARAARDVDFSKVLPHSRSVELPGFTVTVREEIEALRQVAGDEAVSRIKFVPDEVSRRLILSWPAAFDNSYPLSLGFVEDQKGFAGCIEEYQRLYLNKA